MYKYREMDMRLCRPLFFRKHCIGQRRHTHTNINKPDNVSILWQPFLSKTFLVNEREKSW